MLRKLLTHSTIYSLAPQAPKIASLILMPVITQHVTASDYGIYGVITSYLFFLTALKDLGFGVVFVNTFYKSPVRWKLIWRMLHGHLLLWGIFFLVITLAILAFAIPGNARGNYWTIALLTVIPALLFDNTNTIGSYYYRFSQQPVFVALVSVLAGITSVLVTYISIVYYNLGYLGWFIASFASSLVMFGAYFYPVYVRLKLLPIVRFRKKFITPHLRVALPMIPHNYSSYLLNSSDRVVMDLSKVNLSQIGKYNIAYSFGNYLEAFGEAIGMAVGPFYSKLYASNKADDQRSERTLTFFLMGAFLLLAFLLSLWLRELFVLLIRNEELRSAYGIGIIIIMGYSYRPMYWSAGIKLSMLEKTGLLWRISFVAGVLNVVLNIIFIAHFGIWAAAISTMVSLLYIGFSGFFLPSYRRLGGLNHYPLAWMSGIIAMTILAFLLKDVAVPLKLVVSGAALTLAALAFRRNYGTLKAIDV